MSQALVDDDLWTRIEPLLPKRRPRNRQHAGRTPIPDRAVLTGILFVLRSGIPGTCCRRRWGAAVGAPAGAGWCGGNGRVCGNGYTPRCSQNYDGAATSIWPGRSSTVPPSARYAGEKNWTEPYRSPQGRVETSRSYRQPRDSARRAVDRGESERHHRVAQFGRCDARHRRTTRSAVSEAEQSAGRSWLRLREAPRGTAAARHHPDLGAALPTSRQWPGAQALGRRAHVGLAPSISPTQCSL